jgi:hypothetical protein
MADEYLDRARHEISKWESAGPGYLAQVADFVRLPVEKVLDTLVPEAIRGAVTNAIEASLRGLSLASRALLIDVDEVRSRVEMCQEGNELNLGGLDNAAKHYWNWHIGYAAAEGAATGATGLPGLIADIPALFTIAIRLIQEIAICYGYDVYEDNEHEYVLQVLRIGSTVDFKAKMEFLIRLKQVEQVLLRVAWMQMNQALARKEISQIAVLAALRQFAQSLGIQITKRKALQTVPVVGALVGASFNATFINDVGRAAYMSYRRRWIQEHIDGQDGPAGATTMAR